MRRLDTREADFDQRLIDKIYKSRFIQAGAVQEAHPEFEPKSNHYYILKGNKSSTLAYYNPVEDSLDQLEKKSYYGIKPRNAEQTFALNALFNDKIKLVAMQGVAGTGKTLLAKGKFIPTLLDMALLCFTIQMQQSLPVRKTL